MPFIANRFAEIEVDEPTEDLIRHFKKELIKREGTGYDGGNRPTDSEVIASFILAFGPDLIEALSEDFDPDEAIAAFEGHRETQYNDAYNQADEDVPASYLETAAWEDVETVSEIEVRKVARTSGSATDYPL